MNRAGAIALKTGTQLAKAGCEVIYLKSALTDAAREPIAAGRRAIRRGQFAAEDLYDEMVLSVRKQPLKSVAATFGIGFGIGLVTAWMGHRR